MSRWVTGAAHSLDADCQMDLNSVMVDNQAARFRSDRLGLLFPCLLLPNCRQNKCTESWFLLSVRSPLSGWKGASLTAASKSKNRPRSVARRMLRPLPPRPVDDLRLTPRREQSSETRGNMQPEFVLCNGPTRLELRDLRSPGHSERGMCGTWRTGFGEGRLAGQPRVSGLGPQRRHRRVLGSYFFMYFIPSNAKRAYLTQYYRVHQTEGGEKTHYSNRTNQEQARYTMDAAVSRWPASIPERPDAKKRKENAN